MSRFNNILHNIAYFCRENDISVEDASELAFDVLGEAGQLETYGDDERDEVLRNVQHVYDYNPKGAQTELPQ